MKPRGVTFCIDSVNKHTYNDWNLILTHTEIDFPDIKKETLDIPGADGILDFTESLTGDVKYKNRKITFEFVTTEKYALWDSLKSEITNYLHGQRFNIIRDEDPNFYYLGRAQINKFKSDKSIGILTIECDVEPYKYDLTSSTEDWLWDPFDFETGIINECKDIKIDGEAEVIIYGRRKKVVPTISCDNEMQVIFNSNTYNLPAGTQKVLNIQICNGKNILKFVGNGTISVDYRGGSL